MVILTPVPVVVIPPGVRVIVHVPDNGSPLRATLPVDVVQLGGVMVPTTGAAGVSGCALMTIFADEAEIHPAALETVYE